MYKKASKAKYVEEYDDDEDEDVDVDEEEEEEDDTVWSGRLRQRSAAGTFCLLYCFTTAQLLLVLGHCA